MRTGLVLAAVLGSVSLLQPVLAAPKSPSEAWVGVWGYVSAPPPPGAPAPTTPLPSAPALTPLGATVVAATTPPPRPVPPLLDNPGNVPVETVAADLVNVTAREVVRVSAGGSRLRLRFSNEGGADPLLLASVHVALADVDGRIAAGSDHEVHFAGQSGVVIPPGAPVLSDPVELVTRPLDRVYVSVHLPGPVPARAARSRFEYVAGKPGDFTGLNELPQVRLMRMPSLLTLVEVATDQPPRVLVTLGDSITEGAASTANAFRGWPDRLAERLAGKGWAVVNAGISGNRLLRYGAGPDALARLDRDVLSVPGVKAIIVLEGINDIGRGFGMPGSAEPVSAEALEAADLQIIARAHEHGIRVIGATLTPYGGASYAAPAGEAVREALNSWIRTSAAFDGVIDFAPVVADPADPLKFAPAYNDRDHLHPNDAGYKAMADSIDLAVVTDR